MASLVGQVPVLILIFISWPHLLEEFEKLVLVAFLGIYAAGTLAYLSLAVWLGLNIRKRAESTNKTNH